MEKYIPVVVIKELYETDKILSAQCYATERLPLFQENIICT